jgi:gentisate 1,2-dioxygenase
VDTIDVDKNQTELSTFYDELKGQNLAALWMRFRELITPEPTSGCLSYHWRYEAVRSALAEAGGLISAEEAERRVLILENPGLPRTSQITTSLYAGLQLVLPGEVAPAHRHSQSALRMILEGSGSSSVIAGESVTMNIGDLVVTSPGSWHDHRNETDSATIWLDALDIPMVRFFDGSFIEHGQHAAQTITKIENDSLLRYGSMMLPVEHTGVVNAATPIMSYPYATVRPVLDALRASGTADPWNAFKARYSNPTTGGDVLPTIAAAMQLVPGDFHGRARRSTDATIVVPIEGAVRLWIDDISFDLAERDVAVIPSWRFTRVEGTGKDAVVFSYSDKAAQTRLGLWREELADS